MIPLEILSENGKFTICRCSFKEWKQKMLNQMKKKCKVWINLSYKHLMNVKDNNILLKKLFSSTWFFFFSMPI